MSAAERAAFGVYVHWPFCLSKCPYCDFNSHVRHAAIDEFRFARAFEREIETTAARTPGREVTSIFLGGGTPSLMQPQTVGAVLDAIAKHWTVAGDAEVTLEANPTSVDATRFHGYRAAGVNRVSLGVQALDDHDLAFLGREHDVATALAAVELAGTVFPRHSFDLIYARPTQTAAAWRAELTRALRYANGHLSLYQLTIEPGTRFHALVVAGRLVPMDEDQQAELYELTQDSLAQAGLATYEVSNHARPGEECRHNLVYWRYGDYVGIGPGAHGRLTLCGGRVATRTERVPERWLAAVERAGTGEHERESLGEREQTVEMLMMGLRLSEGVDESRLAGCAGSPIESSLDRRGLERAIAAGWLRRDDGRLIATAAGRQRLDHLLRLLL